MSTKRKFHIPNDAEDAALTRAAELDPDNPPLTDAQLAAMRPAREVLPELLGKERAEALMKRRGRPALPADERKVALTMRADPEVIAAFKATGDGWQTRINEVLRDYARTHDMSAEGRHAQRVSPPHTEAADVEVLALVSGRKESYSIKRTMATVSSDDLLELASRTGLRTFFRGRADAQLRDALNAFCTAFASALASGDAPRKSPARQAPKPKATAKGTAARQRVSRV